MHDMCVNIQDVREIVQTSIKLALAEQIKPDLSAIKSQTTLTNGRVNKLEMAYEDLEEEMLAIKESISLHTINCPYSTSIRKLEDGALTNSTVKSVLWKAVGLIISFMALGLTALGLVLR
jgi:hypothetical protein